MSENIILIGFMGSGKDVVGRAIAKMTGLHFLSTDEYIELKENRTINRIFKESGEVYFRKLEKEGMKAIMNLKNLVVATGGGTVIDKENRERLSKMGKVIHLDAGLDVIEKRLRSKKNRPLIKEKHNIKKIFEERKGIYNFAHLRIDTSFKTPERIAKEIIDKSCTEGALSLQSNPRSYAESHLARRPQKDFSVRDTLIVRTASKHYEVHIGKGVFDLNVKIFRRLKLNFKQAVVITNPLVGSLYIGNIKDCLKHFDVSPAIFVVADGEEYKTIETTIEIYEFLLKNKIDRATPIIALGGGVIGDLVGFVASTYKRGIPLIQIPTTLLAQVDAAIGGKTGIDHPLGKNMIGTFYQPDMVIVDAGMLLTLSEKEFNSGLAEVIKYAIIKDRKVFSLLRDKRKKILNRDLGVLTRVISRCVEIKKEIIEKDEREEKGSREILNFGHTIGHAIETLTGYKKYSHGEAVALGMVEETKMAFRNGFLKKKDLNGIVNLISSYGLPTTLPKSISMSDIRRAITQDKKIRSGRIRLPMPAAIGSGSIMEVRCQKFL